MSGDFSSDGISLRYFHILLLSDLFSSIKFLKYSDFNRRFSRLA